MEPIVAEGRPNELYESQFLRVHGYHVSRNGDIRFSDGRVLDSVHTVSLQGCGRPCQVR
jgi:hypothetical protein